MREKAPAAAPSDTVEAMAQPGEWTADRVGARTPGTGAVLLRRMSAGVAVLGDGNEPPGCCLLLVHDRRVRHLADLPRERRLQFLDDLDRLGEAVHNVCARRYPGLRAVGLEIHGPAHGRAGSLHAHVRPSYDGEPPTSRALRGELIEELDRVCAAARGAYPPAHVYGSAARRPLGGD